MKPRNRSYKIMVLGRTRDSQRYIEEREDKSMHMTLKRVNVRLEKERKSQWMFGPCLLRTLQEVYQACSHSLFWLQPGFPSPPHNATSSQQLPALRQSPESEESQSFDSPCFLVNSTLRYHWRTDGEERHMGQVYEYQWEGLKQEWRRGFELVLVRDMVSGQGVWWRRWRWIAIYTHRNFGAGQVGMEHWNWNLGR